MHGFQHFSDSPNQPDSNSVLALENSPKTLDHSSYDGAESTTKGHSDMPASKTQL